MIMNQGMNKKYTKYVELLGIVIILLPLLPFIQKSGEFISGWKLVKMMVSTDALGISKYVATLFLIGFPIIIFLTTLFLRRKWNVKRLKALVTLYTIYAISSMVCLLRAKIFLDASKILDKPFLVKDIGIGFWLFLIAGIIGVFMAMKSAKIHPAYIVLCVLSIIWLFPVFWILMNSLRMEGGFYVNYMIPKKMGLDNYIAILTDTSKFQYVRWFTNTLFVSVCSFILTSFIVLSTSYVISRIQFKQRKMLMNLLLVLGMFPGFMSMIAVYYILKGMGLVQSLYALIIVYSASASLGYYISKGFFDTIPKALDEAAYIDGATKWQVFMKITIPISKPIIIYTILTSFMAPWADYIFASVIIGDKSEYYTIAMGLFSMIAKENIEKYFTQFSAGAVLISIPIALLFVSLQKYYVEGLSGSVKG